MRYRITASIALAACAALASCSEPEAPSGWEGIAVAEVDPAAWSRAEDAKGALFQSLLGELMGTMAQRGPAGAIDVCATVAPSLAAKVGEERGVRIGRTSTRLRNADNTAPDWAGAHVAEAREADGPVAFRHDDGRVGALFPIHLGAPCLACHGGDGERGPGVDDALARLYPDDRATGYALDELRGWFWVEVPR